MAGVVAPCTDALSATPMARPSSSRSTTSSRTGRSCSGARGHGGPSGGRGGSGGPTAGSAAGGVSSSVPEVGGPRPVDAYAPAPSVVGGSVGVALGTLLRVVFVLIGGRPGRRRGAAPRRRRRPRPRAPRLGRGRRRDGRVRRPGAAPSLVPVPVVRARSVVGSTPRSRHDRRPGRPARPGRRLEPVPLGPVVLRVRSAVPPALVVPVGRLLDRRPGPGPGAGRRSPSSQFRHASSSSAAASAGRCTGIRSQPAAGRPAPTGPPTARSAATCSASVGPGAGAGATGPGPPRARTLGGRRASARDGAETPRCGRGGCDTGQCGAVAGPADRRGQQGEPRRRSFRAGGTTGAGRRPRAAGWPAAGPGAFERMSPTPPGSPEVRTTSRPRRTRADRPLRRRSARPRTAPPSAGPSRSRTGHCDGRSPRRCVDISPLRVSTVGDPASTDSHAG